VDDRARRAARFRQIDLIAPVAIRVGVAHDDDLALSLDPEAVELGKVLRAASVGIDNLGRNLPGRSILMIGDDGGVGIESGILIRGIGVLGHLEFFLFRLRDLYEERTAEPEESGRVVEVDIFQPVFQEAITDILGQFIVPRRARLMGFFRQVQEMSAELLARGDREDEPSVDLQ
jgi:hypothetical protein